MKGSGAIATCARDKIIKVFIDFFHRDPEPWTQRNIHMYCNTPVHTCTYLYIHVYINTYNVIERKITATYCKDGEKLMIMYD